MQTLNPGGWSWDENRDSAFLPHPGVWGQIFILYIWPTELQAGQRKPESNWGGLVAILARMKLAHS
jgi:hypothetical protein